MSRKREAVFMGIGILAGLALSGPAAQAATTLTATLSTQPIYVDGQRVSMTAYSIGGNNYVKLRDIGKAMDFGVTYDAATNSVTAPIIEEATRLAQEQARAELLPEADSFEKVENVAVENVSDVYAATNGAGYVITGKAKGLELVGFVDYDAGFYDPYYVGADRIIQPVESLGQAAGEEILRRIEEPDAPIFEKVLTSEYKPHPGH